MQLCHLFMEEISSVCTGLNGDLRMDKDVGTSLLVFSESWNMVGVCEACIIWDKHLICPTHSSLQYWGQTGKHYTNFIYKGSSEKGLWKSPGYQLGFLKTFTKSSLYMHVWYEVVECYREDNCCRCSWLHLYRCNSMENVITSVLAIHQDTFNCCVISAISLSILTEVKTEVYQVMWVFTSLNILVPEDSSVLVCMAVCQLVTIENFH